MSAPNRTAVTRPRGTGLRTVIPHKKSSSGRSSTYRSRPVSLARPSRRCMGSYCARARAKQQCCSFRRRLEPPGGRLEIRKTPVTISVSRRSPPQAHRGIRSEEHTSELQSRPHLVCRLLLEKKKKLPCPRRGQR